LPLKYTSCKQASTVSTVWTCILGITSVDLKIEIVDIRSKNRNSGYNVNVLKQLSLTL
jgi:hypothetical protein